MPDYIFTNKWFQLHKDVWDGLIPKVAPKSILEIGSFEGQSACYLIENVAVNHPIELVCIDSFEGGVEHQDDGVQPYDMGEVEKRFHHNIQLAIENCPNPVTFELRKGHSYQQLCKMITEGREQSFDLIYVDGSHLACDVLSDAVLAFYLLKVGGVIIFDDYLWYEKLKTGKDILRAPKPAIDAFTNLYAKKIDIYRAPLYQFYVRKNLP